MIHEQEWKFLEGTEQRAKHVARMEQVYLHALAVGRETALDPADLIRRRAAILQEMDYPSRVEAARTMDPTPEQTRHLQLAHRWVLQTLLETHPDLAPLVHEIRTRVHAFHPRIRDREATYHTRRTILCTEPDGDLREEAWRSLAPLGAELLEPTVELIRRREGLARTVAASGFPPLAFHVQELDRSEAVGHLDEFERFTRDAFSRIKQEVAATLEIHEVAPWDLEYGLLKMDPLTTGAAGEPAMSAALHQARRWGLDPEGIQFEEGEGFSEIQVLPLDPPENIRILHSPNPAIQGVFRSLGEALHRSRIKTPRYFHELECPGFFAASGFLFEAVLRDPGWLQEHTGAGTKDIASHLKTRHALRMLGLRRQAAFTVFENLVYAPSDLEPHRLYGEVMEQLLHETKHPDPLWPAQLLLATRPFNGFKALHGEMLATGIRQKLAEMFSDAYWKEEKVGAWLSEMVFETGAGLGWRDKILGAVGEEPGVDALTHDLGVTYEGPSPGEAEEISDQTVEDYFQDIDLSDL